MREEFTSASTDGIHTIHAVAWKPEGTPRAVVQIVHGVAEYAGRYEPLGQYLSEHGFLVCGEDHLGHGLTAKDGTFGYFGPQNGWDFVVRDVRRLRKLVGEHYPGIPYILLGHSMGSFLTRTYLIRWPGTVNAAVLSGTGQEKAPLVALGKGISGMVGTLRGRDYVSDLVYDMSMGSYNKQFRPNQTSSDWLSRDEEQVRAFQKDELCSFRPTVTMFRDMLGGIQFIGRKKNLNKMDKSIPVYFLSGDRDPVGNMGKGVRKVARMFREVGCRDVTVKLYPGGRHEMFNEINRQEVMDDLLAWLESKNL